MLRLFVAIPLSDDVRTRLHLLCGGVRDARWIKPENFHLTLRFIGEVAEPDAADAADALDQVSVPDFELILDGVGHFESRNRVRTLWASVDPAPGLILLQERIETALRRAGCAPETRRFKPHITLGRLNRARPHLIEDWLGTNSLFRAGPFPAGGFTLFESRLGHGGSAYIPIAEYPAD